MLRKTLTILSLLGLVLSVGLWGVSCGNVSYVSGIKMWIASDGLLVRTVPLQDVSPPKWNWGFRGGRGRWRLPFSRWSPEIKHNDFDQLLWFSLPLWIPTVFFAMVFFFSYNPLVRSHRKRKKLGLCIKCGYDLRGSTKRCPECNTPIEST